MDDDDDGPIVRHKSIPPLHPGELLADAIKAAGLSKTETARLLGISRQTLHDIVTGRQPVTAPMAVRLGKLFGNGPALWWAVQNRFDLLQAERATDVSAIPTVKAA